MGEGPDGSAGWYAGVGVIGESSGYAEASVEESSDSVGVAYGGSAPSVESADID